MKSPGVEVRPLLQMTGETEFAEIFFHDVRVPMENALGPVGDGWNVAIGTLMHERATLGASVQVAYLRQLDHLLELSHTTGRNGHPAAKDPVMRQKLAQCHAEIEIMRLNQIRSISKATHIAGP